MKRRDFLKGIGLTGLVPLIKRFSPDDEILPEIEDSGPESVSEWAINAMNHRDPMSSGGTYDLPWPGAVGSCRRMPIYHQGRVLAWYIDMGPGCQDDLQDGSWEVE